MNKKKKKKLQNHFVMVRMSNFIKFEFQTS